MIAVHLQLARTRESMDTRVNVSRVTWTKCPLCRDGSVYHKQAPVSMLSLISYQTERFSNLETNYFIINRRENPRGGGGGGTSITEGGGDVPLDMV